MQTSRVLRRLALLGILASLGCGSSDTPIPSSAPPPSVAPPPTTVASATPPSAPGASGDVLLDTDGTLAATDTRMGASYVDRYDVHVEAGQRLRVTVTSQTLDTILRVGMPGSGTLTNDDVAGDRTRSELEVVADATGDLKVSVTTFAPGATGTYHVHVERVTAAPPAAVAVAVPTFHQLPSNFRSYLAGTTPSASSAEPTAVTVHAGDRLQATLAAGDATLPSGEFADYYAFAATPGHYTVSMQSTRIDSYLVVTTPSGERLQNDDSGGTRNASLDLDVTAAGDYRIAATSYRAGETGPYELSVAAASAPSAPTATAPTAPPTSAAPSGARTEHGELAAGDSQLRSGEWFDEYDYTFASGTPVHLEATSSAFDTYLILRAPSGQQTDNDDQQPGNLNAALDFVASEAGQYRVLVTSYAPGMRGPYDLTVNGNASGAPTSPPTTTSVPPTAPTGPAASPGDSTRVWVVSAGITDYPNPANHLPECANDARKIVEALHNQGLSTTDTEFLLTDGAATREGIHHALQTVASRIQPNDTFVFFWSGHGGQASATTTDSDELDGHDEYIFVYDGEIMDDQMAEWMDQIHALSLFALDSCFSGGFAKDVVHRDGVVGLFSSEEDVTSAVASEFQAGGYLSHFLRLGIQGGADDDPQDSVTTVGELTHYVWQQWAQHATDVRMSGGYQQLVEERGAVHTDEVFWRLHGAGTTGGRGGGRRRGR
ncbi:MAG: caspase family protein [Sandaracinus sp.]